MKLLRYCNLLLSLCLALAMGAAQARYDQVEFFHLIERNDVGGTRKALAEGQFNANTFNHEGFSALYLALREPAPEVADLLIEDPRTELNLENAWGENALMMAALRGLLPQAIRMMELGAHVNKKGWAPLHYAASSGHLPMIQLLLDNYAYIDAQSPTGETPLMMAAARSTPAAVQMLLQAEADPKLRNAKRQTAMDMALARNNTNNAKVIRDWLLRGGKPTPTPSPQPYRAIAQSSQALPIGAGSASINNYGAAAPTPTPTPTPIPIPTLIPSATAIPAAPSELQPAIEIQAVPEPGQQIEAAALVEQSTERAPVPMAEAEVAAPAEPEAIPAAIPSATTPNATPNATPEDQLQAVPHSLVTPLADQADRPLRPTPAPSVADIIAQPASRAVLQILSQP